MVFRAELEDFGAFYERTYAAAYRTAWAIARDQGTATDAVQDAYLSAYRERRRFRGDVPALSWLLRIVANRVFAEMRRPRHRLIALEMASDVRAPGDDVARSTDRMSLDEAMAVLDPRARAAIVLRYYDDLDHADIATVLGTNANNVGVILHRALERLQREMGRADGATVPLQEVRHG
jgi:RNA polymerase sigma factor (sigma-70 family)